MNWTCPYCNRDQTVVSTQMTSYTHKLALDKSRYTRPGIQIAAIACANRECGEISINVIFGAVSWDQQDDEYYIPGQDQHEFFRLRPRSKAKPQPVYIPRQLVADYEEACLIQDLSPKASATLARRCIQGMIRDFCKISKGRLVDEIEELRRRVNGGTAPSGVTEDTVDAIDHVRSVGNIGAHMERDIDLIVDVDPGEAETLIQLVEMLFDEWYVARHRRAERLARVKAVAVEKKEALETAKIEKAARAQRGEDT